MLKEKWKDDKIGKDFIFISSFERSAYRQSGIELDRI